MMKAASRIPLQRETVILLVEDNAADAKLLISLFEMEGFHGIFHWVKNGEEALDFLFQRHSFADSPRPDLVLLDLNLPRVPGREILKAIREDKELKSIPVIVMSTSSGHDDMMSSYELNALGFFTKPKDLDEYEAMVKRIIGVDLPLALNWE